MICASETTSLVRRGGRLVAPWRLTLQDYLGPLRVVDAFGKSETDAIDRARRFLETASFEDLQGVPCFAASGFRAFVSSGPGVRDLFVTDRSDRPVAVIRRGLPFVLEPYRGFGIGAAMVVTSDVLDEACLCPSHYSRSGLAARVSAHRIHVSRALRERSEDVPDDVREQYASTGDGFILRFPWGADAQNDQRDRFLKRAGTRYPNDGPGPVSISVSGVQKGASSDVSLNTTNA